MSHGRSKPFGVVVTAEHASNRLPSRYGTLGLSAAQIGSHIAWDAGSRVLARRLAKALGAPLIEGRWSRLLIDLNRSTGRPKLIPAVAFGEPVPGNANLSREERGRRIREYYRPFREEVRRAIEAESARSGRCLHLGIHTFTPQLGGHVRNADVGLLYDPAREWERRLAASWVPLLRNAGFRVRRNYPYRGVADGHVTKLRRRWSAGRYAGIELEVNQALLPAWDDAVRRLIAVFQRTRV